MTLPCLRFVPKDEEELAKIDSFRRNRPRSGSFGIARAGDSSAKPARGSFARQRHRSGGSSNEEELRRERAELLDWVAKNAPRKRNRTMSNPLFLQGGFGRTGNGNDRQAAEGPLYGTFGSGGRHKRSFTTTHLPGA